MTTTTIPHTIRGESYTFGVEIDGDLPEATVTYPSIDAGGPDLSTLSSSEAYPVAAIEAAVSAELGHVVRFSRCDAHGAEGDTAYEVWRFRAE